MQFVRGEEVRLYDHYMQVLMINVHFFWSNCWFIFLWWIVLLVHSLDMHPVFGRCIIHNVNINRTMFEYELNRTIFLFRTFDSLICHGEVQLPSQRFLVPIIYLLFCWMYIAIVRCHYLNHQRFKFSWLVIKEQNIYLEPHVTFTFFFFFVCRSFSYFETFFCRCHHKFCYKCGKTWALSTWVLFHHCTRSR